MSRVASILLLLISAVATVYGQTSCFDSYRCDDGSCIPTGRECNGFPDCTDGSDENSCPTTNPVGIAVGVSVAGIVLFIVIPIIICICCVRCVSHGVFKRSSRRTQPPPTEYPQPTYPPPSTAQTNIELPTVTTTQSQGQPEIGATEPPPAYPATSYPESQPPYSVDPGYPPVDPGPGYPGYPQPTEPYPTAPPQGYGPGQPHYPAYPSSPTANPPYPS